MKFPDQQDTIKVLLAAAEKAVKETGVSTQKTWGANGNTLLLDLESLIPVMSR